MCGWRSGTRATSAATSRRAAAGRAGRRPATTRMSTRSTSTRPTRCGRRNGPRRSCCASTRRARNSRASSLPAAGRTCARSTAARAKSGRPSPAPTRSSSTGTAEPPLSGAFQPAYGLGLRIEAPQRAAARACVHLREYVQALVQHVVQDGDALRAVLVGDQVTDLADAVLQAAHVDQHVAHRVLARLAADVARDGARRRTAARDGHHQYAAAHAVVEPVPHWAEVTGPPPGGG